jgi:predicted acylesterase/phospholipase RssA
VIALSECKVALVLSGGGAKGAYQTGVLQALCETNVANSWDMITGTSIGAMNGGVLAQFNKDQICSRGVPALLDFWKQIKQSNDVYESYAWLGGEECLSSKNFVSMGTNWYKDGGMCSAEPGHVLYKKKVSESALQNSNMEFHFPASLLDDASHAVWFNKQSPSIREHILGSGGLSPVIPPVKVNGKYYVDGSLFHNIPILKALEEGATTVHAILLSPLNEPFEEDPYDAADQGALGVYILKYYMHVLNSASMQVSELRLACSLYPTAEILAVVPLESPGNLLGFTSAEIAAMIEKGYNHGKNVGLVDLCVAAGEIVGPIGQDFKSINAERSKASVSADTEDYDPTALIAASAVVGTIIGALAVFAVSKRKQKNSPAVYFSVPAPKNP